MSVHRARPNEISVVIIFSTHTGVSDRSGSGEPRSQKDRSKATTDRGISTLPPTVRVQRWRCNRAARPIVSLFFASKKVSIRLVVPCEIGTEIVPRNEFRVSSHENRWLRQRCNGRPIQPSERPNRRLGWITRRIVRLNPSISHTPPFGFRTYATPV